MLYIARDTGQLLFLGLKFDTAANGQLNGKRVVPFRITPNIAEFIGQIGIAGPLTASIVATARCTVYPSFNFLAILKTILCDELLLRNKRMGESNCYPSKAVGDKTIIKDVDQAAAEINNRLEAVARLEGTEITADRLVRTAMSVTSLCHMDPAWYPWL
jgi:transformation/transcription domain-associated protein